MVCKGWEVIDIRYRGRQALWIRFKTCGVVHTPHSQAIKVAANSRLVMIEQRGNVYDLGQLPCYELRKK